MRGGALARDTRVPTLHQSHDNHRLGVPASPKRPTGRCSEFHHPPRSKCCGGFRISLEYTTRFMPISTFPGGRSRSPALPTNNASRSPDTQHIPMRPKDACSFLDPRRNDLTCRQRLGRRVDQEAARPLQSMCCEASTEKPILGFRNQHPDSPAPRPGGGYRYWLVRYR